MKIVELKSKLLLFFDLGYIRYPLKGDVRLKRFCAIYYINECCLHIKFISALFVLSSAQFPLPCALWRLPDNIRACADRHSASLGVSVRAFLAYSSAPCTDGMSACCPETDSGQGATRHIQAVRGIEDTAPCCPPYGGNTGISSVLRCATRGLFED